MWECWSKYVIGQNTFYFFGTFFFWGEGHNIGGGDVKQFGEQVDHSGVVKKED